MALKLRFILLFLALSMLAAPQGRAGGAGATELAAPVVHTLDNGLKVIMLEDHKSPLAIFQIWYRVGGMDEVSGKTGLSHLLEHMMFKGTAKYGSKVLSRTVRKNGGVDNAFTSKDYTAYFQILPSDRIGLSLRFEADRMRNLILDAKETLSERDVVMEERRLRYEDDPQNALYELVMASAFVVHPYRRPVIGWMPDLESIEPADLRAHYEKYYWPDNAVIVVVGDINPDILIEDIKDTFGKIDPYPYKKQGPRPSLISTEPPQRGERRVYLKKEAELPYVMAAYHAPRMPHPDSYALDVLAEILTGGKSSRLHRSLVYDKKIALGVSASNYSISRAPSLFMLSASAADNVEAGVLLETLFKEMDLFKHSGPTDFELHKALNSIEAEYIMDQDTLYYQAMLLGWFEMAGDWKMRDTYIDNIRKVSADDVMRVASEYLIKDNRTVGVLEPVPAGETK